MSSNEKICTHLTFCILEKHAHFGRRLREPGNFTNICMIQWLEQLHTLRDMRPVCVALEFVFLDYFSSNLDALEAVGRQLEKYFRNAMSFEQRNKTVWPNTHGWVQHRCECQQHTFSPVGVCVAINILLKDPSPIRRGLMVKQSTCSE